uniref:LRRCT domain-containing protein n=1 Tax=Nothobranchius korthausae TaxID=1143690 RepID=A0A1A8FZH7_9TELE
MKDRNLLNDSLNVTCESPPSLKGRPVWDVSACPTAPPDPSAPAPSKEPPTPTASLPPSKTSVGTKPTDAPPSFTEISSDTKFSTNSKPTSKPVVISVLLFMAWLLVVMQIRKCRKQTVMPECPKGEQQEEPEEPEEDSRSSRDPSLSGHPDVARRRSFTGVRAKSANAVILTSPFCVSEKDEVHFQMESKAPSELSEHPGEKKLVTESGAETGGGNESDRFTTTNVVSENQKPEHQSPDLHENQEGVHADHVPYLSIGTVKNNPGPGEEATSGPEVKRNVFRRISTWPPTAAQWQERCPMKEEDDGFDVWTQNISVKLSEDVERIKMEHPSSSSQCEENQTRIPKHSDALQPGEPSVSKLEEGGESPDPAKSTEFTSVERPVVNSSLKADVRKEPMRSENARPKLENRAAGSKAPSGGASPDDETLLSGNEYVFMDLLHEVVQNHGRWTRERWKQMRVNKQRR